MTGIDEFLTPDQMKELAKLARTEFPETIKNKVKLYNDSLESTGEPNIQVANYLRYLIEYKQLPTIDLEKYKPDRGTVIGSFG